jgi:hypothetical protein
MLNEKTILDNISKICKAKNYQYDIKKIDTHSKFECKCINNHIFVTDYYNLVYRKSGCPSCAPNKKLTQDEAELIVIERCNILNYKSGAFTYIGSIKTKLDLTCECGYNWNPTYTDFINSKTGCPKCSGRLKTTQIEAEQKVSEKCIEKNISCEPFIFINNKMKLNLTCNTCGQNWNTTTYKGFIYNSSCPKCAGVMKLTQRR